MKEILLKTGIKTVAPFYHFFHRNKRLFSHILIQTNNSCTRKCPWCIYGICDTIEKIILPETTFKKIIDQLEEMNFSGRVSLFEINEPLTDERIFDLLTYATTKLSLAWHFMTTNGDILTKEKIDRLFSCGLDALNICSYDEASLQRTKEILKNITSYKNKIRHFNRSNHRFITDNRAGNLSNFFKPGNKNLFCDRVNSILYIKPSGLVVSCFGDFFNMNVMGDVNRCSLKEIWFGERFENLRVNLNRCNRNVNRLCKECNYGGFGGYYKVPFFKHLKKKLAAKR